VEYLFISRLSLLKRTIKTFFKVSCGALNDGAALRYLRVARRRVTLQSLRQNLFVQK
jgi:hypothetical protein